MNKQNKLTPLISVVLPVYNASRFLKKAIESVQRQSYQDIEIICVDDASTDLSYRIIRNLAKKDKRIKAYRLKNHSGASETANFAIQKAKGKFIARMDADDIMLRDRLNKQVKFLIANPEIIAVGGQCSRIDEHGHTLGIKSFPLDHESIRSLLFRAVPIQQPTLMVNTSRLPSNFHWYRKALVIGEDYDLYYRLLQYGKLANLSAVILRYREHKNNLTLSSQKRTFWYIWKSRFIALTRYGYVPDIFSMINVAIQTILVILLPDRVLYPLHMQTRKFFSRAGI